MILFLSCDHAQHFIMQLLLVRMALFEWYFGLVGDSISTCLRSGNVIRTEERTQHSTYAVLSSVLVPFALCKHVDIGLCVGFDDVTVQSSQECLVHIHFSVDGHLVSQILWYDTHQRSLQIRCQLLVFLYVCAPVIFLLFALVNIKYWPPCSLV